MAIPLGQKRDSEAEARSPARPETASDERERFLASLKPFDFDEWRRVVTPSTPEELASMEEFLREREVEREQEIERELKHLESPSG